MDTTVNVWDVSAAYAVARDIAPKWQNPALVSFAYLLVFFFFQNCKLTLRSFL